MAETAKTERDAVKDQPVVGEQNTLSDFTKGLTVEQQRQVLVAMQGPDQLAQYGFADLEIVGGQSEKIGSGLVSFAPEELNSCVKPSELIGAKDKADYGLQHQGDKVATSAPEVKGDSLVGGVSYQLVDGKDVAVQRNEVVAQLEKRVTEPQELVKLKIYLGNFEERVQRQEETYIKQGLTAEKAHEKVQEQIREVYKEMNRLLDPSQESNTGVDEKERLTLAKQILHNSMDPAYINQGFHSTCNVAALEARTYTLEPAKAAHLVADAAMTGKYVTKDGSTIEIDKGSLEPHDQAKSDPPSAAGRNYASQIFQVTAVNVYYQRHEPNWRYEQREPLSDDKTDTGERRVDYSQDPPKDKLSWLERKMGILSEDFYRTPVLNSEKVVDIGNQIMDNGSSEWFISHEVRESDKNVPKVKSFQEFDERLKAASEHGYLPMVISVHTGNEPFRTDSDAGKEGGSGGWHVITVTDYYPGSPPRIRIDNQWEPKDDHRGLGETLDPELIYKAMMLPPGEAAPS